MTTGKSRFRVGLLAIGAMVLIRAGTAAGQSEVANWFTPLPSFSADTFTLLLKGDLTGLIPTQDASQSLTNPFAFLGPSTITVSLVGGNTAVTYTGVPIPAGSIFPYPNNEPHFGLNAGTPPPGGFQLLSETWSNSGNPSDSLTNPMLSVVNPNPVGGTVEYFTVFVQTNAGVGTWFEMPFTAGTQPMFQIQNNSADPITLSDLGFFISPTLIPLDQLNFNNEPPPGSPGSVFTPLPGLDGTTLQPGGDVPLPEPASLVGLGIGLGLLGLARLRSIRGAARAG